MRGEWYIWEGDRLNINEFSIPMKVMDEYVVMRFYEMTDKEILRAEKQAIKKYSGNFGCDALRKKHGLKLAIDNLLEYGKYDKGGEVKLSHPKDKKKNKNKGKKVKK